VKDDNGTPGDPTDDFTTTIGFLAAGQSTNVYVPASKTGTAVVGGSADTATATQTLANLGSHVINSDSDSYFGDAPSISIVKHTNRVDRTDTTLHVPAICTVNCHHRVPHTFPTRRSSDLVKDDNGTPGDPTDDFTTTIGFLAAGQSTNVYVPASKTGTAVVG